MVNDEPRDVTSTGKNDPMFQADVSKMTRYMRFIGICNIIFGAIYCIGIITAIIGVPVIIMGLRLREAADSFNRYTLSNTFQDLSNAVDRQTRFFFIQYVFLIIGLVLIGIYILVFIFVFLIGLSHT